MNGPDPRPSRPARPNLQALEPRQLLAAKVSFVIDPTSDLSGFTTPQVNGIKSSLGVAADQFAKAINPQTPITIPIVIKNAATPGKINMPKGGTPIHQGADGWQDSTVLDEIQSINSTASATPQTTSTAIPMYIDPNQLSQDYFGTAPNVPSNQIDFASLMEREVLHSLGVNGQGELQYSDTNLEGSYFSTFDRFNLISGGFDPVNLATDQAPDQTFPIPSIGPAGGTTTNTLTGKEAGVLYYLSDPNDVLARNLPAGVRRDLSPADTSILQTLGLQDFGTGPDVAPIGARSVGIGLSLNNTFLGTETKTVTGTDGQTVLESSLQAATSDGNSAASAENAVAGRDYTKTVLSSLPFADLQDITKGRNNGLVDFSIPLSGDSTLGPDRSFDVNVEDPSGNLIQDIPVTIRHNNGTFQVDASSISVNRGGQATITVDRVGHTDTAATVAYSTSNGSAGSGTDYPATGGTLSFAPGDTSKTITVATVAHPASVGTTFSVGLSDPTNSTLLGASTTANVTIVDPTPAHPGTFQFDAPTVSVDRTGYATVMVDRVGDTSTPASVDITTVDGSAKAGTDYVPTSGTMTFDTGQTSRSVTIQTYPRTASSGSTFGLQLSNPTASTTLGGATETVNIVDPPAARPGTLQFDAPMSSLARGGTETVTVDRVGGSDGTATVAYGTSDGTAKAGTDYTATGGTLTFGPGVTSETFPVVTTPHAPGTGGTIHLGLANPTGGAGLGTASATLTLLDPINPPNTDPQVAASTTTSLAAAPGGTAALGVPVALVATVASPSGTPSGRVQFLDGSTVIGTGAIRPNGRATFTAVGFSPGSHTLSATYGGDAGHAGSSSPASMLAVTPAPPPVTDSPATVTAGASTFAPAFGQPVTLTAGVAAVVAGLATPSGSVTFFVGSADLGTVPLDASGRASLTTSAMTVGAQAVTEVYSGDTTFAPGEGALAGGVIVAQGATVLSLGGSPDPLPNKQMVTLSAGVASAYGIPTGTVTFRDGRRKLGTAPLVAGEASLSTKLPSEKNHVITATYSGDPNYAPSAPYTVVIPTGKPPRKPKSRR